MYGFVKWLYVMALIVWIGEVIFFSFVVAPGVFRTFEPPEAGRAVAAIFPMYYRIGYGCGIVLLVGSIIFLASVQARSWWAVSALLSAAMLAATLYAGVVLQPRASALRTQIHEPSPRPGVKEEFDRVHRLSVNLNAAVLVCGVVITVITAVRFQP